MALLLSYSASAWADSVYDANQLLQYFGSSCPSQGIWTATALGFSNSLIDVVTHIQNDPDCQSIGGALQPLGTLNVALTNFRDNDDQRQIVGYKRQEEEIRLQLAAAGTDPSLIPILQTQLLTVQQSLAQVRGYEANNKEIRAGLALQQLVTGTNLLLQQVNANERCIEKHPSVLSGIASLTGSVAAIAMTGGASLGVAAGAELLRGIVESARTKRVGRIINGMATSLTATAYQCVLESISNQWCAAQDAYNIVDLKAKSLKQNVAVTPLNEGTRILDRDLPVFLDWLDSLTSGVEASNVEAGTRDGKFIDRKSAVQKAAFQGPADINAVKSTFNQSQGDVQAQWVIERALITQLVSDLGGVSNNPFTESRVAASPLGEIHDSSYAPYYLLGLTHAQAPTSAGGFSGTASSILSFSQFDPFTQWPASAGTFSPNLTVIRKQVDLWIKAGQEKVAREQKTIYNPDALQIISNASIEIRRNSPYKALQNLIMFLDRQKPASFSAGGQRQLYSDTSKKLKSISCLIEQSVNRNPSRAMQTLFTNACPPSSISTDEALKQIYELASLDWGTILIKNRMETVVRIALTDLLINGKSGMDLQTASALLAADDIISELKKYSSKTLLQDLLVDISHSQGILQTTLDKFTEEFGRGIAQSIRDYDKQAQRLGVDQDRSDVESAAKLCTHLLSVPVWPTDVPKELCFGRKLKSAFEEKYDSPAINRNLIDSPWTKRACVYRDFIRTNDIYNGYLCNLNGNGCSSY